jgi:hypothetical protein
MFRLFTATKDYQPVFGDGDSLVRPLGEVPALVSALAKSFRNDRGERANIELGWWYTGTNDTHLDQARFARTIGFYSAERDKLDAVVSSSAHTTASLAVDRDSRDVGLLLISVFPRLSESGFMDQRCTFISKRGHLILDRPIAATLTADLRDQLFRRTEKKIDQITDHDIADFIIHHPDRDEFRYRTYDALAGLDRARTTVVVTIPHSLRSIGAIGTQHAHYPLRNFVEEIRENRYAKGEMIADGHIHEALTPRRIQGDSWLQQLADRYGAVGAASTLTLFDVEQLLQCEKNIQVFGVPWVQYAAREIYVIDDNGEVRGHSVLNMNRIMHDQAKLDRFLTVANAALDNQPDEGASDAEFDRYERDYRLPFHEMIQEFTTRKGISEPLAPTDYSW